jgi:hypothetical protein
MKIKHAFIFLSLCVLFLLLAFEHKYPDAVKKISFVPTPKPIVLGVYTIGVRTKTKDCKINGPFADFECSPGAIFPDITAKEICEIGYAKSVRNVSDATKELVFEEYGITTHTGEDYEVDHIVSLELGGSNDIANLYPEAAEPRPGFHEKDKVENYLHDQVCAGEIDLSDAQTQIANDWLYIYKTVFEEP